MRLIHGCFEFFPSEERGVHHFPIGLEVETARGGYLDVVDTVVSQFTDSRAHSLRSIGDQRGFERLEFQRERAVRGGRDLEDWTSREQTRALDEAALDGIFQLHIGITPTMRP